MSHWHITLASSDRSTIFIDDAAHTTGVRCLARLASAELVLFCLVDDHLHLVVAGDRARAGRLTQRLSCALRARFARVRLSPGDIRPVNGRSHLLGLVRYLLTQPAHHGLDVHPALHVGSCFLDLAAARFLPGLRLRLPEALPRLRLRTLLELVGLPPTPLEPASPAQLRQAGLPLILAAAAAALAVPPGLHSSDETTLLARRAVVQLSRGAGFTAAAIASATGWPARTVTRHAAAQLPPGALRSVRLRVALVLTTKI